MGHKRVREPLEPPDVEVDILVRIGAGREVCPLRPGHHHGERGKDADDGEDQSRTAHDEGANPISCMSRSAFRDVAIPGLSR